MAKRCAPCQLKTKMKLQHPLLRWFTCAALCLLNACDQAQPVSYKIPKEERPAATPGIPTAASDGLPENHSDVGNAPAAPVADPSLPPMEPRDDGWNYSVPKGWTEKPASSMRRASFSVDHEDGRLDVSVSVLGMAGGGKLANINRWCGQVGLESITLREMSSVAQPCLISKHHATYVELFGEEQAIVAAILSFHGKTWFFKMQGPVDAARQEVASFKQFLNSIVIEDTHH